MKRRKNKLIRFFIAVICISLFTSNQIVTARTDNNNAVLSKPSGLKEVAYDTNSVTLSWDASNSKDVEGYEIFMNERKVGRTKGETQFKVKGLSPDTMYKFSIRAIGSNRKVSEKTEHIISFTSSASDKPGILNNKTITKEDDAIIEFDGIQDKQEVCGKIKLSGYVLTSNESSWQSGMIYVDGVLFDNYVGLYSTDNNSSEKYAEEYKNYITKKFSKEIDTYKIGNGLHKIAIEVENSMKEIEVNINNKDEIFYMDPISSSTYEGEINLTGYFLSSIEPSGSDYGFFEDINSSDAKVYFDGSTTGVSQSSFSYGKKREGLKEKYPQYNKADYAGFSCIVDLSSLDAGKHTVKFEIRGKSTEFVINVKRNEEIVKIDSSNLTKDQSGFIHIKGYILSSDMPKNVYKNFVVDIDGKEINTLYSSDLVDVSSNLKTEDLVPKYPSYNYAGNSGIDIRIDSYKLTNGIHDIKIKYHDVVNEYKVTVNNQKASIVLDDIDTSKGMSGILNLSGYLLSSYNSEELPVWNNSVYIDGDYYGYFNLDKERSELKSKYPNYQYVDKSGFNIPIDTLKFSNGSHTLKIKIRNFEKEINFNVNNPKCDIVLESMKEKYISGVLLGNSGYNLEIKGYLLSPYSKRDIEHNSGVCFDGNLNSGLFNTISFDSNRADLINKYPDYKYVGESGFSYLLDVNNVSNGIHTLKFAFGSVSKEFKLALYKGINLSPISSESDEDLIFDYRFYADMYSDLKAAFGYDEGALRNHFKTYGIKEGRIASPVFDVAYYLANNSDLVQAFGAGNYNAAYNHFLTYGINEGRVMSPIFDSCYYRIKNIELKSFSGHNLLKHFVQYGMSERRQASQNFNVDNYIKRYPYLKDSYGENYKEYYEHYIREGISQGLNGK